MDNTGNGVWPDNRVLAHGEEAHPFCAYIYVLPWNA
jgi:hypothetical protein